MRLFLLLLLLLPSPVLWGCDTDQTDPASSTIGSDPSEARLPPRGHAWVIIGSDTVTAEVADTPQDRERGLMYREHLGDGEGMLFVFEGEATRSFWMRNTFIPLDIAFLDRTQVIVDIQRMEPLTEELHESARPAMFALEVPDGWFASRETEIGDRARIVFGRR